MDDDIPYSLLFSSFNAQSATIVAQCGPFVVSVSIKADDLDLSGECDNHRLRQEFLEHVKEGRRFVTGCPSQDPERFCLKPCHSFMRQLGKASGRYSVDTLADLLHPPAFAMQIVAQDGQLQARFCDAKPHSLLGSYALDRVTAEAPSTASLGRVKASSILVDASAAGDRDLGHPSPIRVRALASFASDSVMVYKSAYQPQSFFREIETLSRWLALRGAAHANIPEILGLVEDDRTGLITGFLMTCINPGPTLSDILSEVSLDTRRLWWGQISEAVRSLHGAGLTWGDVKPHNVLIDADERAWVIDFEGGYTEGWADPSISDLVERDLDALEKMKRYLALDACITPEHGPDLSPADIRGHGQAPLEHGLQKGEHVRASSFHQPKDEGGTGDIHAKSDHSGRGTSTTVTGINGMELENKANQEESGSIVGPFGPEAGGKAP